RSRFGCGARRGVLRAQPPMGALREGLAGRDVMTYQEHHTDIRGRSVLPTCDRSSPGRAVPRVVRSLIALVTPLTLLWPREAAAQDCASPDPADWPQPGRPYFMIAFDTSGSMETDVGSANSCG